MATDFVFVAIVDMIHAAKIHGTIALVAPAHAQVCEHQLLAQPQPSPHHCPLLSISTSPGNAWKIIPNDGLIQVQNWPLSNSGTTLWCIRVPLLSEECSAEATVLLCFFAA